MGKTKKYEINYDQYEDGANSLDVLKAILEDPERLEITEVIIGYWGEPWDDDGCQKLIDGLIEHAQEFSHVEKLFIGDMGYEECEVSWIIQGNYSGLWAALPNLKELTIKGSSELTLGSVEHENLEALTIICGGLPGNVISEIQKAKLPNLKKLLLYIGIEDYGFDGDADTIRTLLKEADFPGLEYLGIADSEIQDELAQVVLESKFIGQIHTLDLSCGTLSDKGGELLLEKLLQYPNIKKVDLHYHYLSYEMMNKLEQLPVEFDLSEQEIPSTYRGEVQMYAMLTE